jgi:hypothetical protein
LRIKMNVCSEIIGCDPSTAKITVLCFRNEFPILPLFCGVTLMVVEDGGKTISQWESKSIDHLEPAKEITYNYVDSKKLTQQLLLNKLRDEDLVAIMARADNPKAKQICQWLPPLLINSSSLFSVLSLWDSNQTATTELLKEGFKSGFIVSSVESSVTLVRSLVEVITSSIIIAADFADIRESFSSDHCLMPIVSSGTSKGANRAITASRSALETLDLSVPLMSVTVSIYSGLEFELFEYSIISELLESEITDADCSVVIAIILDPTLVDTTEIKVDVISCSYPSEVQPRHKKLRKSKKSKIINDEDIDLPAFLRRRKDD